MLELEVTSQRLHLLSEYVLFYVYDFWNWLLTLNYTCNLHFSIKRYKVSTLVITGTLAFWAKTRYIQSPNYTEPRVNCIIIAYHLWCSELFLPTFIFYIMVKFVLFQYAANVLKVCHLFSLHSYHFWTKFPSKKFKAHLIYRIHSTSSAISPSMKLDGMRNSTH